MSHTATAQQMARYRTHELGEDVTLRSKSSPSAAPLVVRAEFVTLTLEQRMALQQGVRRVRVAELDLEGYALDSRTTLERSGGEQLPVLGDPAPEVVLHRGARYSEFFVEGG